MMRFLFFIAVWFTLGLTCSCVSTQRAISVLKKNGKLAAVCANEFPVRDSIIYHEYKKIDTVYFISDSIRYRDTVVCGRDTIFLGKSVVCPPGRIIQSVVYRDSVIIRKDSAAVAAQKAIADKEKAKADNLEKSLSFWRRIALFFVFFTFGIIAIKIIFKV